LRLHDNAALAEAGHSGPVVGVFVLNPALLARHARATRRIAFMYACLGALDAGLRALGSRLLVVEGAPAIELPRLAAGVGAGVAGRAGTRDPGARAREARGARVLERDGMPVRAAEAALVQPPGAVTTSGGAYQVYGAYVRAWEALDVPPVAPAPRDWVPA